MKLKSLTNIKPPVRLTWEEKLILMRRVRERRRKVRR